MELGLVRRLLLPSEIFVSARYGSAALTLIYTYDRYPINESMVAITCDY